MFSIKPYELQEARVGALEGAAASAVPIFTLGAIGGIFGGTLWGKAGFGIGALAGSLAGILASRIAKASGIDDGAALEQSELIPDDAVIQDKKNFSVDSTEDDGFEKFGTSNVSKSIKIDMLPQISLAEDEVIRLTKPFNWTDSSYQSDSSYATKLSDGQRVTFYYTKWTKVSDPVRYYLEGTFIGNGQGPDEPGNRVIVDRIASGNYPFFKKGVYQIPKSIKHTSHDDLKKMDPRKYYDHLSPVQWKVVDPKSVGLESFPFAVPVEKDQRVTVVLRDDFGNTVVALAIATGSPEYGIFDAIPQSVYKVITDVGMGDISFDDTPIMVYTKNNIVDPKSLKK